MKTCMYPGCQKNILARGLCNTHYSYCHTMVAVKGITTWEKLEKAGKCLPPKYIPKTN